MRTDRLTWDRHPRPNGPSKGASHKGLVWFAKYGLFSASKNASIVERVASPALSYTLSLIIWAPINSNAFPSRMHPLRSLDSPGLSDSHPPQVSCYSRKYRLLMSRRIHCSRPSFLVFLQPPTAGLTMISLVWHVQLAYKRKGTHYQHYGHLFCYSAACSCTSGKPFGLSSSGSPSVRSFHAAKRGNCTTAYVILSFARSLRGTHIFAS